MTRWIQCSKCKGLGITKDGKACLACKGKLCVAVDIKPKKATNE